MKYSSKLSFFLTFALIFSGTLVILGLVQAYRGTLRWYNPSEEQHEQLNNAPVYAQKQEENKNIFSLIDGGKEESPNIYFSARSADVQEALQTVTPEKASKIRVRVAQMQTVYEPDINQESSFPAFQSPVELRVKPDNLTMPKGYTDTINTVIAGNYFRATLWNFPITVDRERTSPRGQMSNESITLSGKVQSLSEVAKVLVHELGHIVDIYVLRSSGLTADPSRIFYTISWSEATVLRSGVPAAAFVSGYAASNQYEDFAEAFAMYVFHNKVFQERASKNSPLQQKYDFLHEYVFGEFFRNSSYEKDVLPAKIWDVTKVVIREKALNDVFSVLRYVFGSFVA